MNANEPTLPEESLFLQALEIDSPDERVAFLDWACGADAELRNDVEALLRHHREGTSFLETPPTEVVVAAEQLTTSEAESPALDFLSPSDDPLSLGRLGYYEVVEVLGRGGFGVVFKARDTKLDRIVAVKTLAQSLASSATARKRFVREAKAAAAVKHENVVGIYHVSDDGPVPYLVMECVSGVSLEAKLQEVGTLDLPAILRIGTQIASGLAAAHKQGLVHRDVKPGNILLENGVERVKITDFGLARAADDAAITRTGEVAGTPQYMSPEQAQGLSLDARSDLFSLGSVLYAMATGRSPFRAESTIAALRRVCDDTPRPIRETNADIPEWLAGIINRLLAKQPSERYQTATEVADLLGLHLAAVQQSAIVPSPKPTIISRRHPSAIGARWWSVALIALVAMACIMGLTEASGVTQVVPTVIRIVRGEGTLVIEVADPTVKVSLDGKELSIRGAGLQEFRLLPGQHRLHAKKDGQPVKDEIVTITRDGRKVVTVTLESPSGIASSSVAPAVEEAVDELTLLTKLQGHTNIVRAVSFLPDGQRMVSVDQNTVVRTWDLETRSVLSTLDLKGGRCSVADVSADGRFVAISASAERTRMIRVWDLQNRKQICEAVHQQDVEWLNCIRFTPDGTHVLTSGKPHVGVLWNIATGKEVQRFEVQDSHSTGAAQFSPDGRLLAMEGSGRVRLFDVESGELQGDAQLPQPANVISLAFSPSGDLLACGHMEGRTDVFEVNSRQLTASLTNDKSSSHVVSMRFIDNERLLITRFGGAFEVWDLPRTKIVATAASETGTTKRLAVSPDGRYALTAHGEIRDPKTKSLVPNGDYALRLWQLPESVWPKEPEPTPEDLKLLAKLDGHSDLVRGVAFLPDGRRFVSVGRDKMVRVWDLATRSILSTLPVEGYLRDADVSADGRLVAMVSNSGDKKGVAQVWDIEKQERLCALVQDVNFSNCIRFSPDGTCVVTIGSPSIGILWDLTTKKEIGRFDVEEPGSVQAIEFSPDGRRLAIGASGRVRLFDIESGDVVGDVLLPQPRAVISLAFSSDGKSLACGQMGGHTSVIDVKSRELTAWLTNPKSSSHVISMRFLDNERLLLTRFHGAIEVWDRARMKIVATAASETGTTKRLAISPDGRYALTTDGEGWDDKANKPKPTGDYALRLWQLPESVWPKEPTSRSSSTVTPAQAAKPTPEDLKLLAKLEGHSDIVPVVAFVPDGRRIISVGRDQTVSVWDVQSRSMLSSLSLEGYLTHADVSTDGRFVAMVLRQNKVVQVWDLEKRQRVCDLVHDFQSITCMRLSPDGTRVVTSGNPAHGVLWDVSTGKELRRFDIGETSWAEGGAFSPDGRVLALGAVGRVRLFDIESGDVLGDISLPDNRTVSDLEFAAKGKALASGQAGGHVSLVDVDTRRVIKRLQGSVADLRRLRFLANDTFLLTSSQDGTLRVWDLERGKVVATATTEKGTNGVVSVSPEGRHAATANQGEWDKESRSTKGNGDYALRLWQLPESVWPTGPPPLSSSDETVDEPVTPKDP